MWAKQESSLTTVQLMWDPPVKCHQDTQMRNLGQLTLVT